MPSVPRSGPRLSFGKQTLRLLGALRCGQGGEVGGAWGPAVAAGRSEVSCGLGMWLTELGRGQAP